MKERAIHLRHLAMIFIQLLLWLVFYLLLVSYAVYKWNHTAYAISSISIATISYFVAVYGNALWLMPYFLQKKQQTAYLFISLFFCLSLITLRILLENIVLMPMHKQFYDWRWPHISFVCITILVAFLFGVLLRVALNHVQLLKVKTDLQQKQVEAELNLLKGQVQPHFLFNTLNNIYALAQSKSERTPDMIAKLSGLMRYFIDEAPKEKVLLTSELSFIKNYIELEEIRMLHPATIHYKVEKEALLLRLPPMLLMPFIENVFKHGIDKLQSDNIVQIDITYIDNKLIYMVSNSLPSQSRNATSGFGLDNLQKRLQLLFNKDFSLKTRREGNIFKAELTVPVYGD